MMRNRALTGVVDASPRLVRPRAAAPHYRVLFTKSDATPERTLFFRTLIVAALVALVIGIMWWDRDGLRDNVDNEISFSDVVYFTMVTITTVGYGDITPVTRRARLIDGLLVTPIRLFIWFIFLGTAYQFVFQKMLEEYRMSRLQRHLKGHVIVCGYGHTGRSAAGELVAKGHAKEQIVVIDASPSVVQEAADEGFVALCGDAARENVLAKAGIDRAAALIVTPGRDDTNVLIVLTARQMQPGIKIVAGVKEEENIKIVKQGGANVTVSPSKVGGYLLADAIDRVHVVDYLYDLMTAGGSVTLTERPVRADEIGSKARAVADGFVVGVQRGQEKIGFWDVDQAILRSHDVLLLVERGRDHVTPYRP
jgi:voltage-gated potassium channel